MNWSDTLCPKRDHESCSDLHIARLCPIIMTLSPYRWEGCARPVAKPSHHVVGVLLLFFVMNVCSVSASPVVSAVTLLVCVSQRHKWPVVSHWRGVLALTIGPLTDRCWPPLLLIPASVMYPHGTRLVSILYFHVLTSSCNFFLCIVKPATKCVYIQYIYINIYLWYICHI